MTQRSILLAGSCLALVASTATGREWSDSTGKYSVEAEMVAFNEQLVVLKKADHSLVAVPLTKLSAKDNEYLRSKEAADLSGQSAAQPQTWTMQSGLKVIGKVVDYGRRDMTIQRRRGRIYVNDRPLSNLPEVYRRMVPKIVAHFENIPLDTPEQFEAWVLRQKGQSRTFTCEGVVLELENGDEYGVPFFFFAPEEMKILQPGWDRWLAAANDKAQQEQHAFLLQSQAQAYQRDHLASQQIAMMQLQMQAYSAGLFDLWEVRLYPRPGVAAAPVTVVVPARDSRTAAFEAAQRNPGFVVGPVARVTRK
jgi:hypothetical protein